MDALVWALTELAGGSDNYLEYMRREVKQMAQAGEIEAPEAKPEILVRSGSHRDRCECGSTAFVEVMGRDECALSAVKCACEAKPSPPIREALPGVRQGHDSDR